jgi:hypothetical protein
MERQAISPSDRSGISPASFLSSIRSRVQILEHFGVTTVAPSLKARAAISVSIGPMLYPANWAIL